MRKEFSNKAANDVLAAANEILLAYGMPEVDSDRLVHTEGDLKFIRDDGMTRIEYQGEATFDTTPNDKGLAFFLPDDWMDEVERIYNALPPPRT